MPLSAAQLATAQQMITKIYVGYFDRAPDSAGLSYWIGRYDGGMSFAQIAQSFSVQTEATNTYPYLASPYLATPSTFLTQVYKNLFNRAPDTAGLAYWSNEIASGRSNVGNAIINIISGAQDTPASGTTPATLDLTTLNNVTTVGLNWALTQASTPGSIYNAAAAANAAAVILNVNSSAASVTTANAATAAFFAAGGGIPVTGTALGTGVDNVTTGNNNITGTFNGSTATFNTGDTIAPSSGMNSLTLTDLTATGTSPFNVTGLASVTISGVQTATIQSAEAVTVNTANTASGNQGWSGLTSLTVADSGTNSAGTAAGATSVTAGASTNVNLTTTGALTTAISVTGGQNVTANVTGTTAGGGITIGTASSSPTGTVTVNETMTSTANTSQSMGAISVRGGTVDSVTQTVTAPTMTTAATAANTQGAVTFTGTSSTTSVTSTQATQAGGSLVVTLANNLAAGKVLTITDPAGGAIVLTVGGGGAMTPTQVAQVLAGLAAPTAFVAGTTLTNTSGLSVTAATTTTGVITINESANSAASILTAPVTFNAGAGMAATVATSGNTGSVVGGAETITDVSGSSTTVTGTITSVTLTGGNGATITDNALANANSAGLTLNNLTNSQTITLTNNLATQVAGAGTLKITVSGDTAGSAAAPGVTLTDTNNELTGLAFTVSGTGNNNFNVGTGYTRVATVTVGGTGGTLNLGNISNMTALTGITLSGAAGLSVTSLPSSLTTITDQTTGNLFATIDATKVALVSPGTNGNIYLTVSAAATRAEQLGAANSTSGDDAVVWNGTGTIPASLAGTGGSYTGVNNFILGSSATAGTYNLSTFIPTGNTLTQIGFSATSGNYTMSGVNLGTVTTATIDGATSGTDTITSTAASTAGAATSLAINIGLGSSATRVAGGQLSATSGGVTVAGITLNNAATTQTATDGIGTLTIAANASLSGQTHTITTLTDTSLSSITNSGSAALSIGTLSGDLTASLTQTNNATSMVLGSTTNQNASGLSITDANLASLTFAGTGFITDPAVATSVAAFTLTNNNSYTVSTVATAAQITTLTSTGGAMSQLNVAGSAPVYLGTFADSGAFITVNNTDTNVVAATVASPNGGLYVDAATFNTASAAFTLNLSGTGRDLIAAPTIATPTSVTLIDSDTGTVTIGASSITAAAADGSGGAITITNNIAGNPGALIAAAATTETFSNSGTGTFVINESQPLANAAVVHSSTLTGAITYNYLSVGTAAQTILGASDNSTVTLNLNGAGALHSVTLGNGNNVIRDANTAADTFTLGSGNNNVAFSGIGAALHQVTATSGNNTINFTAADAAGETVTIGAGLNTVNFNAGHNTVKASLVFSAANGGSTSSFTTVSNSVGGTGGVGMNTDTITFANLAINNTVASAGAAATVAAGVATAQNSGGLTGIVTFTNGGTTYIYENTGTASTSELVAIVGSHTVTSATSGGATVLTITA